MAGLTAQLAAMQLLQQGSKQDRGVTPAQQYTTRLVFAQVAAEQLGLTGSRRMVAEMRNGSDAILGRRFSSWEVPLWRDGRACGGS